MTPIKFRAWDTKQLIMIAPYGQYASQHLCRLVADILFSPDYTKTEHPYLFQQYTGLAASDGREIYE